MKPLFLVFIIQIFWLNPLTAQQTILSLVNQERNSSYRGLSVVDDETVWVSGSNGTVGLSTDAGKNWQWVNPIGYEKTDFRDIEAFDENEAIVISAGSPAIILRTSDGGRSWKEVFSDKRPAIFYDGMAFTSEGVGIAFGDAIQGKMPLLKSVDFGASWKDITANMPFSITDGEAGFAASGTSIYCNNKGTYWIATGGTVSNIYRSDDQGNTWARYSCPILQGKNSTGPFSIAFYSATTGIVVGGDYKEDTNKDRNSFLTNDGGKTWFAPQTAPNGFKSAVVYCSKKQLISTGTSGTDLSTDGGKNWIAIGKESFNAVQKAKRGNAIYLAGDKGKIAKLTW